MVQGGGWEAEVRGLQRKSRRKRENKDIFFLFNKQKGKKRIKKENWHLKRNLSQVKSKKYKKSAIIKVDLTNLNVNRRKTFITKTVCSQPFAQMTLFFFSDDQNGKKSRD